MRLASSSYADFSEIVFEMGVVFYELEVGRYSTPCYTVPIRLQETNLLRP